MEHASAPHVCMPVIMTARKILTHVILPAACYCDHIYDIHVDGNIKLHDVLKTLLYAPYKPPEETLCLLADITPRDITGITQRLSILGQILRSGDTQLLQQNSKSKLQKRFSSYLIQLNGRGASFSSLTLEDLKASRVKKCSKSIWERRWTQFYKKNNSADGLLYTFPTKHFLTSTLPLHEKSQTISKVVSVLTGHAKLAVHQYKLGHTYSPTCVCLKEDETICHYIFNCKIYNDTRKALQISPTKITITSLIEYIERTNRL